MHLNNNCHSGKNLHCCQQPCCAVFPPCPSVPNTFSVIYNPNGGIGGGADFNLISGSSYTIKLPESTGVSRPGSPFLGWNTLPDGNGTAYSPGQIITITGNLTLYAQWLQIPEQTVSITYNANGGTGSGAVDSNVPLGEEYTVKRPTDVDISRQGFTFITWSTAADGSGDNYAPGQVIVPTADMTLYAQWEAQPIPAVITYNANGGTGGSADSAVVNEEYTFKRPADANVSRQSASFITWSTVADGSGTNYAPGEVITVSGDLTVYAIWQIDQ